MKDKVFRIEGTKGIELSVLTVQPDTNAKAVVQIFHGMGEHKMRYLETAKEFAKAGYAVFVHDHRKHGKSARHENEVGIFESSDKWQYVIRDCHIITKRVQEEYPDLPIIILGHSMGSIIARKYISQYPQVATSAIIMGTLPPITKGRAFVPLFLAKIIKLFKKDTRSPFLADALNKPLLKNMEEPKTKFDWLTTDDEVVQEYIDDSLSGYAYSPKFYIEFFNTLIDVNQSDTILETKDIPLLFIAGKLDPVGEFGDGVKKIREIYSGHGYTQLTTELIEDARHEILNETNKKQTVKFIIDWMNSTIK